MEVPDRTVTRADLFEEQVHSWGFTSVFVVAQIRCATCGCVARVVGQPVENDALAAGECLRMLTVEGWRVREGSGPTCPKCIKAADR